MIPSDLVGDWFGRLISLMVWLVWSIWL